MYRHGPSRTITLLAPVVAACLAGCAGPSAASTHASATAHTADGAKVSPTEANQRPERGQRSLRGGHTQHPRQDPERRTELANTQHPFAVVLGCADSRTGPEVVFDQGLGDLFVVREAGNVVDDHTLGSIEYAVEHLHSP
jgi:carbonic anhydrase